MNIVTQQILRLIGLFFGAIAGFTTLFVFSLFGGTVVWLIWPYAVHAFPGLVASGAVASNLNWVDSVALTWLCSFLIKSGSGAGKGSCPEKKETGKYKDAVETVSQLPLTKNEDEDLRLVRSEAKVYRWCEYEKKWAIV